MKKIATLVAVAVVALSLAACATTTPKDVKVKCPACGYEFMAPYND